jgi:outer membrane biosynthesis protein TonB
MAPVKKPAPRAAPKPPAKKGPAKRRKPATAKAAAKRGPQKPSKPAAKPKPAAKRKPKPKPKPAPRRSVGASLDLHSLGARVIGIFGTRGNHTLIQLPTEVAEQLFADPLAASGSTDVIAAAERDVAAIKKRDKALGESALARAAVALAFEINHPWNSATSKSMCAREMRETIDRLRELAPEEEEADQLDDLRARRAARIESG